MQGPKGTLERVLPDLCNVVQVTCYAVCPEVLVSCCYMLLQSNFNWCGHLQEESVLKVVKPEYSDPAKRRKAYAQHGLIR